MISTVKHQVACCLKEIVAPRISENWDGKKVITFLKMKKQSESTLNWMLYENIDPNFDNNFL